MTEKAAKLSPEEEAIKLKLEDRWWRLNNLYWVEDDDGNKVKFKCRWSQKIFYWGMHWLNDILKVRQLGISTFCGIFQLDLCLFVPNQTCGIIDITEFDAIKKLSKVKFAYEHLDDPDDPATADLGKMLKQAIKLDADSSKELAFSNGSKIWAGVTMRGGRVNFLHISELGYIAFKNPTKAKEIAAGSFNTVHANNWIVIESTHEGGRVGLNYEMIQLARKSGENPGPMDWKMFFFAWWQEPKYELVSEEPVPVPERVQKYFTQLEKECHIELSVEKKNWYVKKAQIPSIDMARQFPGTIDEALEAKTEGAIYGDEMAELRSKGRIIDFEPDVNSPLFTVWDLGNSDYTAIWLMQIAGRDVLVNNFYMNQGKEPAHYAAKMLEWEALYKRPFKRHFWPHDAKSVGIGGVSWASQMEKAGLYNYTIVPRTPDIWQGINALRALLPRFYFHASNCSVEFEGADKGADGKGKVLPSGIACMEGYHKNTTAVGGKIIEAPVHDETSHSVDAMRTFSEGHALGLIDRALGQMRRAPNQSQTAITGISKRGSFANKKGGDRTALR
jgi:hypothetical protein